MVGIYRASIGLLIYTFLGYPALMAALARLRPRPVRGDPDFVPTVTLIIAAYNEGAVIGDKLANVDALDYPPDRLEVIVVADGSEDDTVVRASESARATVLFEPQRRGKLAAIMRAATQAGGEVIVFSDANNLYSAHALRELVRPLADPSVGVVTGRKHIAAQSGRSLDGAESLYWRYESKLKEWESATGSLAAVVGEILAFRRDALYATPAGMLVEDFVQAMLAAARGWRVVYAPDALSIETASASLTHEATRRSRLMTGVWQAMAWVLPALVRRQPGLAWQVLSHKGLRPLVPGVLSTLALSSLSLSRSRPTARALTVAQAGFYGAAALGRRDVARGRKRRWTYLPYYFCRMNAAAMTGVAGLARHHDGTWTKVPRAQR